MIIWRKTQHGAGVTKKSLPLIALPFLLTACSVGQRRPESSAPSIQEYQSQIEKARRAGEALMRQDFRYVALGWTRILPKFDAIVAAQYAAQKADPEAGLRSILSAQRKGLGESGREEILRCLVALRSERVMYRPSFYADRQGVMARANVWMKDLTLTEYRVRTLAHMLAPEKPLVPAFDRLLRNAPFDWRTEILAVGHFLQFGRRDEGLRLGRSLVKRFPQHARTLMSVARAFDRCAYDIGDRKLYGEADTLLARAQKLPLSPGDRAYLTSIRQMQKETRQRLCSGGIG